MYTVKGTTITLTRGDTFEANVTIKDGGSTYTPESGDSVRFAVKHNTMTSDRSAYTDSDPLILKQIPTDTMLLVLDPDDTKPLDFGTYAYDCEITFADGKVSTFIKGLLILSEEVH